MKKHTDSKTFCILPFIHHNIKMEGKVNQCWRAANKLGDSRTHSLEEIWNNEPSRQLRKQLLNDEQPHECESCWDFESKGVVSTRQKCNDFYQKEFNIDYDTVLSDLKDDYSLPYNPTSIEIRFDNTCNLRCRHCSPAFSSKWESVFRKNTEVKSFYIKHGGAVENNSHSSILEKTLDEIKQLAPSLKEIIISGGEPLVQKMHWEMIDALEPYAHNIKLVYNSNLNQLGTGEYSVLKSWPKFKNVVLRVSVDGDEKTYEYFRVYGKIDAVKENLQILQSMQNLELHLSVTVNIYNISRIPDMVRLANNTGSLFHIYMLQHPTALNIKVLPAHLKDKIYDDWSIFKDQLVKNSLWNHEKWKNFDLKLLQIKKIISYGDYAMNYMMSEDLSKFLNETKEYIEFQDKLNSTNFAEVYPEMIDLLK